MLRSRSHLGVFVAALLLAAPALADGTRNSGSRSPGHAVKETTRDVGHATRDVVKSVGHATRNVTRSIGHAFRDLAKKLTE